MPGTKEISSLRTGGGVGKGSYVLKKTIPHPYVYARNKINQFSADRWWSGKRLLCFEENFTWLTAGLCASRNPEPLMNIPTYKQNLGL
mgnify:CR=1 FL=1